MFCAFLQCLEEVQQHIDGCDRYEVGQTHEGSDDGTHEDDVQDVGFDRLFVGKCDFLQCVFDFSHGFQSRFRCYYFLIIQARHLVNSGRLILGCLFGLSFCLYRSCWRWSRRPCSLQYNNHIASGFQRIPEL